MRTHLPHSARGPDRHRRRGLTLIHLLVVMSMLSVLTCFCGVLLAKLFRQHASLTTLTAQTGTWTRLSRDFRRDLHAATAAEISGAGARNLLLNVAGERIHWTISADVIRRTVETSKAAEPGKTVETGGRPAEQTPSEKYVLANSVSRFEVAAMQPPVASLIVEAGPDRDQTTPVLKGTVEAVVGFDHRWERSQP